MKNLIVSTVLAGTFVSSFVVSGFSGCSSPDKLGEGNNNAGNGGSGGKPTINLDASVNPGQGGSGGNGTSGSPPTGDANCGSQTSNTTREPPDVLLVLDRSGSMMYTISEDCFCSDADAVASGVTTGGGGTYRLCADTSNCQNRWSAVKPAVTDTVANAKDVHWGLKFFPTADAAQCSVSNTMEVEIGPDRAEAVRTQVESSTLSLSTPTAAALTAATNYLKSLTDNRPRFILLATDGEPNCAGGQITRTDVPGAANAAKAAYSAGFPVFVVGIGPNLGNLTQLASSGGTKDYYPVSSPQDLVNAFADISKIVASCTFTLSSTPPDINNIGVYLDKNLVDKDPTNGWSLGAGNKTVILNGDSCDKVTSGKATEVQLLFGCPGQPPPLTIP